MSKINYPNLFSSATLGSVHLQNRAMVAPMTRISATSDGIPTDKYCKIFNPHLPFVQRLFGNGIITSSVKIKAFITCRGGG